MRKLAAAVAAAVTTLGLAVAAPSPAIAAGTCTLAVPAKVSVTTPYRGVNVRLGADCAAAGTTYASWDGYHPTVGWEDILIFDGASTGIWDLYDYDPLGRRDWRPSLAHDADYGDVAQYRAATDIRLGSAAIISSSRSRKGVTIGVRVARYAPALDRPVPWTGVRAAVQWRSAPAAPWRHLRWVQADRNGRASFTYRATVRQYRVVVADAPYVWGVTSAVTRR